MPEENSKTLDDILTEAMTFHALSVARLAEMTSVPERYILALREGEFAKLPAAPYVRGYLLRIGQVLNVDGGALWDIYKHQGELKTSGLKDKLPINRFAIKNWDKRMLFLGGVIILVVIYVGWRGSEQFLGTPKLDIMSPAINNIVVGEAVIKVSGAINPQDKLTVNGEETLADSSGHFEKDFSLQEGINTIEFRVKKLLGKEITITRNVIYKP